MSRPKFEERERITIEQYGEFPMRIAFYLVRYADGKFGLNFRKLNTNIQLKNHKLSALKTFSLDGSVSTPLAVADFKNYKELDDRLDSLAEAWIDEKSKEDN